MEQTRREIRVLVVDDDDSIRTLLSSLLHREGFAVDLANDGIEAIEKIQETEYDAVILDVMMPRLDGLGVVDRLKSTDRQTLEHVILLTASHADDIWEQPVFDVITKPFDIVYFIERTKRCIAEEAQKTA